MEPKTLTRHRDDKPGSQGCRSTVTAWNRMPLLEQVHLLNGCGFPNETQQSAAIARSHKEKMEDYELFKLVYYHIVGSRPSELKHRL